MSGMASLEVFGIFAIVVTTAIYLIDGKELATMLAGLFAFAWALSAFVIEPAVYPKIIALFGAVLTLIGRSQLPSEVDHAGV